MPLFASTSTYLTGISGEIGSGFAFGLAAACGREVAGEGKVRVSSDSRAAASAKSARHADVAVPFARKKRRPDAVPVGALSAKLFRRVIACGRRPKAPFAETAYGHSPASARSKWTGVRVPERAPARFDSHRG